jgi:Capsule polysaccharide biosynthesis protein
MMQHKKNVLIVNANRSASILGGLKNDPGTRMVGALVYEPWDFPEWSAASTGLETWGWNQIATTRLASSDVNLELYERALKEIMHEPRVFFLIERHFGVNWNLSLFNKTTMIEHLVWNTLVILSKQRPDVVFATSAPHNPISWVFCKVAELWGARVLMMNIAPFFHRRWVVEGLDGQSPIAVQPKFSSLPSQVAVEAVEKSRMPYARGIPGYSRAALKGAWQWRREIKYLVQTRPQNAVIKMKQALNKWMLYRRYCHLSRPVHFDKPYYVFFLHYQPEATTLPYGLEFSQQWLAISRLRMALPSDIVLVVKEHPGMFLRGMLRPSVRDTQFYDAIAALPNTTIADINQDSFKLIDHASCVTTITGTVGFQAILRGRPVIVFGAAPYRHFPSVFHVSNIDDLVAAIDEITKTKYVPNDEEIVRYATWVEGISFGIEGVTEEGEWFSRKYDEQCLTQAFSHLVLSGWTYEESDFRLNWSGPGGAEMPGAQSLENREVS